MEHLEARAWLAGQPLQNVLRVPRRSKQRSRSVQRASSGNTLYETREQDLEENSVRAHPGGVTHGSQKVSPVVTPTSQGSG